MANTAPTSVAKAHGDPAWLYVGADERGRELEVIAVEVEVDERRPAALVVIHVMPTHLCAGGSQ